MTALKVFSLSIAHRFRCSTVISVLKICVFIACYLIEDLNVKQKRFSISFILLINQFQQHFGPQRRSWILG